MAGFPLLRLPFLPSKDILDDICPRDLTMMYLCSEKSQNAIKLTKKSVSIDYLSQEEKTELSFMEKIELLKLGGFPKDDFSIKIIITDKLEIQIASRTPYDYKSRYPGFFPVFFEVMPINRISTSAGTKNILKIDDINVPVKITNNHRILTFWEDPFNGLYALVNYWKKVFNTQSIGYILDECNDLKFSQNLRTAVKALSQHTIKSCLIQNDINCEDYKYVLDNVKPKTRFEHIYYYSNQINNFQHETNIQSIYFKLSHANWFTLDNLSMTNCKKIELGNSKLTNSDMYEYLKLWMDGKFSKLKYLAVELREPVNLEYIFHKLRNYSERFELAQSDDFIFITQSDGINAKIINCDPYYSGNMLQFFIYSNFMRSQ